MPGHIIEFHFPAWRCRCRYRSDETAGSHAGTGWNIFQMEDHRGERTGDHRGECRWNPDFGFGRYFHLEHRGSESLCQKTTHLFHRSLKRQIRPSAQQPAVAAPPARPSRLNMMQIAALLIGASGDADQGRNQNTHGGCMTVAVFTRFRKRS